MAVRFFDRRVRVFGNVAVLILCAIFFMIPFGMRGARESLSRVENNIKDWLPKNFPETKDLEWFGKHFVGERFILATWEGCHENDVRFRLMVEKLRAELAPQKDVNGELPPTTSEDERVRRIGDKHALLATGNYYQNFGERDEKWLLGDDQAWYFITPTGELYKWDGGIDLGSFLVRSVQKLLGSYEVDGELIATVGSSTSGPNPYYAEPRKMTARLFNSLRTGPEALAELAVENGPLWPRGDPDIADEDKPYIAQQVAYARLTGTLFGPAVGTGFSWEVEDFKSHLPEQTLADLPSNWEQRFTSFVDRLIEKQYGGNRNELVHASANQQTLHWDEFFSAIRVDPPPRQTCLILTMSEVGKRDLGRVLGRPILGKPPGRLLDLAMNECNISLDEFKMGGPPVDNVAIDEEGTITLVRLVSFSAAIGIALSFFCFRSFNVTLMVFFVGGISAVASLAIVFWSSAIPAMAHLAAVDAVLLSMPSLVYVLGLSGAVHIVNYYREAVAEKGVAGAAERALAHGWGPCTLAAFTTSLGLVSLYTSNLLPIKKFGLFSAMGVMMTLMLLFFYLPSALTIWPFAPRKQENRENDFSLAKLIEKMWLAIGRWVIGHHWLVATSCITAMIVVGLGLQKIETSVQLLKLFDADAKIIGDYRWLERNYGKLVPMELVVKMKPEIVRPPMSELRALKDDNPEAYRQRMFQLNALERLELVARIQQVCERVFGEWGQDIIGKGMSAATFVADLPEPEDFNGRGGFNDQLEDHLNELPSDYVRSDNEDELWRISERLGALNDVDYGEFVHEQKLAVEPVLTAYRFRNTILRELDRWAEENGGGVAKDVILLGFSEQATKNKADVAQPAAHTVKPESRVVSHDLDQTEIFGATLLSILRAARYSVNPHDPDQYPVAEIANWERGIQRQACVVLLSDHPDYDIDFLRENARVFIDARDHIFKLGESKTAAERGDPIQVVYTGVVPVVYKAQRTLLNSLIESIGLAFVMIAAVMMILLRDWRRRPGLTNTINVPAGMVSMLPNVFPLVLIFGVMGHMRVAIDIGTMMCASVAMGVAVDDTIHYLTWFRTAMRQGMNRNEAILEAYRRVATAMTQTTLIGGLGLSVFALSTFTPTQRFGVMMVTLLSAALIGDLILLPALLAGPLGRFFALPEKKPKTQTDPAASEVENTDAKLERDTTERGETRHSGGQRRGDSVVRADSDHKWPRH